MSSRSFCLVLALGLLGLGILPEISSAQPAPCVADDSTLCLNGGRFEVTAEWEDFEGGRGVGHAMPETPDTGWFWFFDPDNVELLIKVLDGRVINDKFWVFYGSLSNVEYTVTVRDTVSGEEKIYPNPSGRFASVGDAAAFPLEVGVLEIAASVSGEPGELCARAAAGGTSGPCVADETTLCLQDGRFRVQVTWEDFQGGSGVGKAVPRRDDSGFFWFFDPANLELVVKVLDGRTVNGNFWVFFGALSNVEYRVTVEDTVSGRRTVYENPAFQFASVGDTERFDGSDFCGGIAGFPCLDGQLCDPEPGSCQVADVGGTCRAIPGACPAVFDPVCGCDGRTYGNDCERQRAGVAKDHDGACEAELCGGIEGLLCPADEFCNFEPGACRTPDAAGRCEPVPDVCTDEVEPVCGCNDTTYGNDCERRAAGVPKLHDGACVGAPCNTLLGFPCATGDFCDPTPGTCNIADAGGECTPRPEVCPADFVPVCGCNGVTYGNDCERRRAQVGKDHDGACAGRVCGTIAGIPCDRGEFCELPVGSCEVSDAPGLCRDQPEECILLLAPVCGCDGTTYDNDCFRQAAGVTKDHDGPCEGS